MLLIEYLRYINSIDFQVFKIFVLIGQCCDFPYWIIIGLPFITVPFTASRAAVALSAPEK